MTAIITKQNAKDKAFIGGGGGDGSTDGLFNSLHVLGDTTLDGAVTFTANNKTISDIITDIDNVKQSTTSSIENINNEISTIKSDINDHETRITKLEEGGTEPSDEAQFTYESGINEFIISTNDIKVSEKYNNVDDHTFLYFENLPSIPSDYDENILKFSLPSIFDPHEVYVKHLTETLKPYFNPKFEYDEYSGGFIYSTYSDTKPGIVISNKSGYNPFDLYTNGEMMIEWVASMPKKSTTDNVKCNIIEADNAFRLYRSPLPNLFEFNSFECVLSL